MIWTRNGDVELFMNPKVSIVIPYYNDKKYITETLESVNRQTYQNMGV